MKNLWDTLWFLSLQSDRIDICFDLYKPGSVKASERRPRASEEGVRRKIYHIDQPLPKASNLDSYWSLDENKIEFQQFFITWIFENYFGEKPVYLGGCHSNGEEENCYRMKTA